LWTLKSEIRVPAWCGEGLLPDGRLPSCHYIFKWQKGVREISEVSFMRVFISFMRGLLSLPNYSPEVPLFDFNAIAVRISTCIFWFIIHTYIIFNYLNTFRNTMTRCLHTGSNTICFVYQNTVSFEYYMSTLIKLW
jgi:hypothetical protein